MKKALLLAAAMVAAAPLASPAVARDRGDRAAPTANQIVAREDVRIAQIKAALRLTPEQEKSWPSLETALRDAGKVRAERQVALQVPPQGDRGSQQSDRGQSKEPADFIAFLTECSERLSLRSAELKKLADAAQPLYASLDEQLKKRFANELTDHARGRNSD